MALKKEKIREIKLAELSHPIVFGDLLFIRGLEISIIELANRNNLPCIIRFPTVHGNIYYHNKEKIYG